MVVSVTARARPAPNLYRPRPHIHSVDRAAQLRHGSLSLLLAPGLLREHPAQTLARVRDRPEVAARAGHHHLLPTILVRQSAKGRGRSPAARPRAGRPGPGAPSGRFPTKAALNIDDPAQSVRRRFSA
ncbi:MAG: hypothetical protein ACLP8S_20930 [Solirubrobacteraceae bacterium]